EGLCPPYVSSMDEAVDLVIEEKYGPGGIFQDPATLARAYQRADDAETYIKIENRNSTEAIRYTKDVCNYIYDTYGRFPAHIDSFYTPGMWLQFSHLEIEYYDKFFDARLYPRQAKHDAMWHGR